MKVEIPELEQLLHVVIAELRALRALLTSPDTDDDDWTKLLEQPTQRHEP